MQLSAFLSLRREDWPALLLFHLGFGFTLLECYSPYQDFQLHLLVFLSISNHFEGPIATEKRLV
jgi:hypothetical protein